LQESKRQILSESLKQKCSLMNRPNYIKAEQMVEQDETVSEQATASEIADSFPGEVRQISTETKTARENAMTKLKERWVISPLNFSCFK